MYLLKPLQVIMAFIVLFGIAWVMRMRRAMGHGLCEDCGQAKQHADSRFCSHCGKPFSDKA